ncbi:hypothetical protein AB0395_25000 [Streptosporangium sp. NPDC051023]|uniref:hypothetical protein n=1 Tax=Streptosporangium sp. NPDC051023 TaxID=3155410 RepID=UPI00344B200A
MEFFRANTNPGIVQNPKTYALAPYEQAIEKRSRDEKSYSQKDLAGATEEVHQLPKKLLNGHRSSLLAN